MLSWSSSVSTESAGICHDHFLPTPFPVFTDHSIFRRFFICDAASFSRPLHVARVSYTWKMQEVAVAHFKELSWHSFRNLQSCRNRNQNNRTWSWFVPKIHELQVSAINAVNRLHVHMTSIGQVLLVPWSMHNLVMRHIAQFSVQLLRNMCPGGIFSFQGHRLVHPLTWPCSTRLLPLGLHQEQCIRVCPADICNSKQRIQECIQGIPKETLQLVVTTLPIATSGAVKRHVVTHK